MCEWPTFTSLANFQLLDIEAFSNFSQLRDCKKSILVSKFSECTLLIIFLEEIPRYIIAEAKGIKTFNAIHTSKGPNYPPQT